LIPVERMTGWKVVTQPGTVCFYFCAEKSTAVRLRASGSAADGDRGAEGCRVEQFLHCKPGWLLRALVGGQPEVVFVLVHMESLDSFTARVEVDQRIPVNPPGRCRGGFAQALALQFVPGWRSLVEVPCRQSGFRHPYGLIVGGSAYIG